MAKKKTDETIVEEVAAEEVTTVDSRRIERQRLTWAGLALAAVLVFGAGYVVGSSTGDDFVASDTAVSEQADDPATAAPPPARVDRRDDVTGPRAFDGRGGPDHSGDRRPGGGPDGRRGG